MGLNEQVCRKCGSYADPTDYQNYKHSQRGGRKLFKWLLRVILVLAAGFFALVLFLTRDLYMYSTVSFFADSISESEKRDIQDTFKGTFLIKEEEDYTIFDLQSGLCFTDKSINKSTGNTVTAVFTLNDNYAYVELTESVTKEKITITFYKASILKRISFATRYYSWSL